MPGRLVSLRGAIEESAVEHGRLNGAGTALPVQLDQPTRDEPRHDTTILIVDDDTDVRALARAHLQAAGHRVREARDGAEALRVLAEEPVHVILLDIHMPKLDGFGLLERLAATPGESPKVVIFSIDDRDETLQHLSQFNVAGRVIKPYRVHQLLEAVEDARRPRPHETAPASNS
jgi:two-component system chemotaxis response regulator CheY